MRRLLVTVGVGAACLAAMTSLTPVAAYPDSPGTVAPDGACEGQLIALHNQERTDRGLPALREDRAFDQVSRGWSLSMARNQTLAHNPTYPSQMRAVVPGATTTAENVGRASSAARAHGMFMDSPGHRGNILSTRVQRIAVGCIRDASGQVWITVNFMGHPTAIADRRPAPFASAGSASGRLRYWMLSKGPDPSRLESDTAAILGGTYDAAGFAAWLAATSAHSSTVPAVTRLYYATFLRHPDAAGLTYWIRERHRGVDITSIGNRFAASREFVDRYGALSDAEFVDRIYRNVLGRSPDASGLTYWTGRLAAGWTRGKVLTGISESAEHKTRTHADVTVSWAWIQLIARPPTAAERSEWTARIGRGTTVAEVVTFLVRSGAMATRAATHTYD